jgi:teichuronic acid biosynthesis glycosyltransferase TuaG
VPTATTPPTAQQPPCIALCTPMSGRGGIASQFFNSWRFMRRDFLGPFGWYQFQKEGLPIEMARNMLTTEALEAPIPGAPAGARQVTHLMWIDDDMVFPHDLLMRLLAHDLPFVGGLCHDRRHPYKPVMERHLDPKWGCDPGAYGWLFDFPKDQLVEVDATGGACLLVKREVYEKIREDECRLRVEKEFGGPFDSNSHAGERYRVLLSEYCDWWSITDHPGHSEDLAFCDRVRTAGYKIFVDTSLDIGHIGQVIVNSAFAELNREFEFCQTMPDGRGGVRTGGPGAEKPGETLREAQACTGKPPEDFPAPGQPVATVVIPTYNQRPEFLRCAVQSALEQTVPVEVIVVDDGSEVPVVQATGGRFLLSDDSMVFEKPEGVPVTRLPLGVRVIRHAKNQGIAAALNTGIKLMRTKWFCWLSSDDWFQPSKVEHQMSALLCARAVCGYHGYNLRLDNSNAIGHQATVVWSTMEDQHRMMASGCFINGTTVMIHKSVFDRVGVFDTSFKWAQDWQMWARIGKEFLWHGIPDKLATRREFGNLTERVNSQDPESPERKLRDAEDLRVQRQYSVRTCKCCGEPIT